MAQIKRQGVRSHTDREIPMLLIVLLLIVQACGMIMLHLLGISYDLDGLTLIFIALITLSIIFTSPSFLKDKNLYIIFLIGMGLRLALLFFDYYVSPIMHSGADTESFFRIAQNFEDAYSRGIYYRWLALLFMITGPARLFAQYVNLICGLFSCLIMLEAFRLLGLSGKSQRIGFLLLCLLPNWADMSAILLRESLIGLFVSFSLLAFTSWYQSRKARHIIAAIFVTLPAIDLHSGMVFLPIAILAGYIVYDARIKKIRLNMRTVLGLFASLAVIALFIANFSLGYIGNIQLDSITRISNYAVTGSIPAGSAYLQNLASNSWTDVFLHTPIRLFYFFFSPLPLDFRGLPDMIAFTFTSVPILVIFYHAICALFTCGKNRKLLLFLLLALVFGGIVYAWGTFAAGTAMRHRDKLTPLYVLVLAVALDSRATQRAHGYLPVGATDILERVSHN